MAGLFVVYAKKKTRVGRTGALVADVGELGLVGAGERREVVAGRSDALERVEVEVLRLVRELLRRVLQGQLRVGFEGAADAPFVGRRELVLRLLPVVRDLQELRRREEERGGCSTVRSSSCCCSNSKSSNSAKSSIMAWTASSSACCCTRAPSSPARLRGTAGIRTPTFPSLFIFQQARGPSPDGRTTVDGRRSTVDGRRTTNDGGPERAFFFGLCSRAAPGAASRARRGGARAPRQARRPARRARRRAGRGAARARRSPASPRARRRPPRCAPRRGGAAGATRRAAVRRRPSAAQRFKASNDFLNPKEHERGLERRSLNLETSFPGLNLKSIRAKPEKYYSALGCLPVSEFAISLGPKARYTSVDWKRALGNYSRGCSSQPAPCLAPPPRKYGSVIQLLYLVSFLYISCRMNKTCLLGK